MGLYFAKSPSMLIRSFIKTDFGFRPVQVEVVLVPGVSQIQILGLADQVIKESSKRILSALRHQGFRVPPGKQVLVNLYPHDLRKSSQGLDLAIAMGILIESEQIKDFPFDFNKDYVYGSLSLKGDVQCPEDLNLLNYENFQHTVLMGPSSDQFRFTQLEIHSLSEWQNSSTQDPQENLFECKEHSINKNLFFHPKLARLMSLVALGEHPLLIAGYAGSGKTTTVENLAKILNLPEEKLFLEAKKYWKLIGRDLFNRPIVQPHHSATPISMIGGGRPLKFGEISLAHGGALILDELLEFHPLVQSALREPMEKGVIHLARAGTRGIFPANMLVLATTNLCPCGNFQPGATYQCQCSSLKLRNYIEKLTGPFLDRFCIFYLHEKSQTDLKISLMDIKEEIKTAKEFQIKSRKQLKVNQKLLVSEIMEQLDESITEAFIPFSKSHRRRQSLLRVARSLADLEASERIKQNHLEEAQAWTASDIYKLERFRAEDFAMRQ